MATIIAWTLKDQLAVIFKSILHHRRRNWLLGLIAIAILTAILWQRVDYHQGTFGADFNQDFDVSTVDLRLAWSFELKTGGGSLNLVNMRLGIGKELLRFPSDHLPFILLLTTGIPLRFRRIQPAGCA